MEELNFPNSPSPNDTYLDHNGKLWRFNDGYWQEDIISFSIDLLRDVITIVDTDTIPFVSSDGTESSIDATEDFPFILSNGTTSNIPFTPYGLPFYTSDGTYDGIDIIKQLPDVGSVLVWDGSHWVVNLLVYSTSDIIGLDLSGVEEDDIMMWQDNRYVPDSKDNHTLYEIYDDVDICIIEGSVYIDTSDIDRWYPMDYTSTILDTTGTQSDLANDKITCRSAGIYEISQTCDIRTYNTSSQYNLYRMEFTVYDSSNNVKYRYNSSGGIYYGHAPHYFEMYTLDYVDLNVGDYIKYRVYPYKPPYGFAIFISGTFYSNMTMKKIGSIPTGSPEFVKTISVDARNDTTADPQLLTLPAGTYEMRPVVADFIATSPYGGAWQYNVRYKSAEITERLFNTAGYDSLPQTAFDKIALLSYRQFTITYEQTMSFWYYDSNYSDNAGGSCFELYKIV